jgi:putative transposase
MQRFKSSRQAQDFLSAHSFIYGHFRPRRRQPAVCVYRESAPTPSMPGTRKPAPGT